MPENELISALRELVRRGVLTETGEDEFAFRHALVREAVGERLLGRERRRLHEAALDAFMAAGDADWALLTKHARGAGRYDDMLVAARDGSTAYLAMGSAFQALQLAEIGLEEDADNRELLRNAAHAAWLAGLLDDADAYARRWQSRSAGPDDEVAALNLRIRLGWDRGDLPAMTALSNELSSLIARLEPGLERARGMAMLAQSTRLRDLEDESLDWADRTTELTDALGDEPGVEGVRLAALVEKGALLAARAATLEEGRSLLSEVADRAEAAQEWLVAALALNKLVHLPPATSVRDMAVLLERMRAAAERAGSEKLAVAAYYQGRARLFMQKGNLAAAIDAIERGRAHDLGYQRSMTRTDFHGVFLAGLRLEAGDLDGADQITADLADVPGMEMALPGLRFHIACRRGDVVRARAMLPDVVAVVQSTGGRDGEFLHDLVSAAIVAPLTIDEVAKLIDGLGRARGRALLPPPGFGPTDRGPGRLGHCAIPLRRRGAVRRPTANGPRNSQRRRGPGTHRSASRRRGTDPRQNRYRPAAALVGLAGGAGRRPTQPAGPARRGRDRSDAVAHPARAGSGAARRRRAHQR